MVDRVGQRLDNYRLDCLLGEGAFGQVYLGEHIYRKQQVAIKVLQPLAHDDLPGFLNEARTFRLRHPNIVQVLDFGLEERVPFIVMEYAPYGTLRQRHARGTQLPLDTIVLYVKQIADALQYAHSDRLVHRDIKPENMLVGVNEKVLVSDFGLATMTRSSRSFDAKGIAGTVAYMAPEQIQGKPCAASDQYALGIVVYEWLSGHLPFSGSLIEVATQHMLSAPPSLLTRVPELSFEVEQVILKALEKDPNKRFISIKEFADSLEKSLTPPIGTTLLLAKNSDNYRPPIAWSPDGKYLALSIVNGNDEDDNQEYVIQVWSIVKQEIISTYNQHALGMNVIVWSSDCKRIASSGDRTIDVWNAHVGKTLLEYTGHISAKKSITSISWSSNAKKVISVEEHGSSIHVWDAANGKKLLSVPTQERAGMLTWSTTNLYFAAVENWDTVNIWDANTGSSIFHYSHSDFFDDNDISVCDDEDLYSAVNAIAWSPDGRYLASCAYDENVYNNTVKVFDTVTKKIMFIYRGHSCSVYDVAWSPNGKRIASISGSEIHIFDGTTGDNVLVYNKHANFQSYKEKIESIAWSPNNKYVASGNGCGKVDVWDVTSGNIIFTYDSHVRYEEIKEPPCIEFVTWSATGNYIASMDNDGGIYVWIAPH